jgi:hypothetical protein
VYRFSRRELRKIFVCVQTLDAWRIHTAWLPFGSDALKYFPFIRRSLYPVINRPSICRILTSVPGRWILKALFRSFNMLAGHWGNSLIVVASKKTVHG